ncbi:TonB-dependent receptor [Spirosoma sp. KCTC 42546]|uniref:TonB-dependent receptor n=1 Tax=Spirosoma sp. KCTC 42546 TaxID=2520506 RepID=UPI001158631C|nr:TonB-dependent receptor [Spirosoma sp. KCTC 42546]QDK80948.1 TonB-dependent receptor [Spirosoma sp. KCTC 42546]
MTYRIRIKYWLLFVSCWFLCGSAHAQTRFHIYGQVMDGVTNKPLANVSVYDKKQGAGTTTDSTGAFSMQVLPGPYNLTFSAVGYYTRSRFLEIERGNIRMEVALNPDTRQLDEVNVKGRTPDANVSATQMSVVRLDMKNLRNIPVVFGEVDILKALTLQPGVSTVGEGAGGFNVRGGRTDQNLVLLDGAPLFNTSHLLGLLSNLNADAIQDVTLYKGGIPAAYGGRLSSLLIMNTKPGETDRIRVDGGMGLLTSRLMVQGPVTKNKKLTFLAGGRIAYPSFILGLFPEPTNKDRAFFYDLNGRLTYRLNADSQVSATVYRSYDTFKFPQDTLYTTQSTLLTARWSQRLNPQLSFNLTATQSDYRFFLDGLTAANTYRYRSTIRQRDARLDWLYSPKPTHRLEFGGSMTGYSLLPGSIVPTGDFSNINSLTLPTEQAREWAGYISEEWTPVRVLSVQVGVRYAQFTNVGPGVAYQYAEGQPRTRESITDTLRYNSGQAVAQYGGWEPRLTIRANLTPNSSLKVSYNRTRQFLHLISNTTAISPVDFWKVSDALVPPQVADQLAVGYFRNFNDNMYETSIEVYHKTLENLVEYRNGATLLLNPTLDADLLRAQGKAYGVEVSVQKTRGLLTGLIAYTYSRTLARVSSPYPSVQINGGEWYPSTFDRPHNLTIATQWKWSRGWTFGTNFIYTSGRPTTYPDGTYRLNGAKVLDYSQRNADRIPDYHRLDVSFTKDGRRTPGQRHYSNWSISFYNVYAHKNPYSIYFQRVNTTTKSYQLSVFGTIIPSISWNFTY